MSDIEPEEGLDVIEASVSGVTDDGDVVSETVTAVVDEETGEAAVDDLIVVEGADGSIATDERISVIDADGEETEISETVMVMDADGNIASATTEN
jgi:hypothetical protein